MGINSRRTVECCNIQEFFLLDHAALLRTEQSPAPPPYTQSLALDRMVNAPATRILGVYEIFFLLLMLMGKDPGVYDILLNGVRNPVAFVQEA